MERRRVRKLDGPLRSKRLRVDFILLVKELPRSSGVVGWDGGFTVFDEGGLK